MLKRLGADHPSTQAVIANHLNCLHKMERLEAELPNLPQEYRPVWMRLMGQAES